ncbi:hypothetical protein KJ855_03785 [Patescibacteria group bacterium]|nr:hypothetical protein [Patescibacteria group bacterium]
MTSFQIGVNLRHKNFGKYAKFFAILKKGKEEIVLLNKKLISRILLIVLLFSFLSLDFEVINLDEKANIAHGPNLVKGVAYRIGPRKAEAGVLSWVAVVLGGIINPLLPPHERIVPTADPAVTLKFNDGTAYALNIAEKECTIWLPYSTWDELNPFITIVPGAHGDGQGFIEWFKVLVNGALYDLVERKSEGEILISYLNRDDLKKYCVDLEKYNKYEGLGYSKPDYMSYRIEIVSDSSEASDKCDPDFTLFINVVSPDYFEGSDLEQKISDGEAFAIRMVSEGECDVSGIKNPIYFNQLKNKAKLNVVDEINLLFSGPENISLEYYAPELSDILPEYASGELGYFSPKENEIQRVTITNSFFRQYATGEEKIEVTYVLMHVVTDNSGTKDLILMRGGDK